MTPLESKDETARCFEGWKIALGPEKLLILLGER